MTRTTEQVFAHHMQALAAADLPALMEDYVDDAVLMAIDRVYPGKEAVRAFFTGMYAANPNMTLEGTGMQVHGDYVLVSWKGSSDTLVFPWGNDTFVIRGGLILLQTVCFSSAVPS